MKTDAILWDYDGTLANTAAKNIAITKEILAVIAPRLSGENSPACLKSEEAYHEVNHSARNWQELYLKYYGLTEEETQRAGALWTEYQLKNKTPVNLFHEIKESIQKLSFIPHGICSQNSAKNIRELLARNGINEYFKSVIGYDDIAENGQKPNPESGLKCLNQLFDKVENKVIVYIGDHEADVEFARNIAAAIDRNNQVFSIAVKYSGAKPENWSFKPDYIISKPYELVGLAGK